MSRILPTNAERRAAVAGAEEPEIEGIRSALRRDQRRRSMTGGALGGGVLLAGFGLVPALVGTVIGAVFGYLFERSVEANGTHRHE